MNDSKNSTNQAEIQDVNQSFKAYMKSHRKIVIPMCILSIVSGCALAYFGFVNNNNTLASCFFLPFILPAIYLASIQNKLEHLFFQQFAKENNFSYQAKINNINDISSQYLREVGHGQYLEDIIAGNYKNISSRLYRFNTTIGYGKGSHRFSFSVFEMEDTGNVSDIIVENISFYNSPGSFSGKKLLSLEGDFNKYFKVYVPEGYEVETLEILTPDIMEEMIQTYNMLSFEFTGNKLFIYSKKVIENKDELDKIFLFSETLTQKLASVLGTLNNDQVK